MLRRNQINKNRRKQVIHLRDSKGRICLETNPIEAYWCVDSEHALIFLPGSEVADFEWSRSKMIEMGWF